MQRRAEFRPFSWLNDLWKREQLDLSPPYQRRSVWPERFRSDFITTVLLSYPCPAIFLYEEIRADGSFLYKVVDGKQRLTTLFDFVSDKIAISEDYPNMALRDRAFSSLDDTIKRSVWRYAFSVEFIEQENEAIINDIFNRINKNVAKLTPQELRHARFAGLFINKAQELTEEMEALLPPGFPNIAQQSRRQMKDIENVAVMLVFAESGERSLSQTDLDKVFSDRDEEWPEQDATVSAFRAAVRFVAKVLQESVANTIQTSRLRNQADFYSLYAAVLELQKQEACPTPADAAARLSAWVIVLREVERGEASADQASSESRYLGAARAASNDPGARRTRINIVKAILLGS
ncbi:MAG TPA: DUF262 domain-containing protein [Rhodopila sp.]|jgi:hypothetical protein